MLFVVYIRKKSIYVMLFTSLIASTKLCTTVIYPLFNSLTVKLKWAYGIDKWYAKENWIHHLSITIYVTWMQAMFRCLQGTLRNI